MAFSMKKVIHRLWFVAIFIVFILVYFDGKTLNPSITIILNNESSLIINFIAWIFFVIVITIMAASGVYLLEMGFFTILFKSEVVGKQRMRYTTLRKYSEEADKEQMIGFMCSFLVGLLISLVINLKLAI